MADMTFKTDLYPDQADTYALGSSTLRWKINGVTDPKLTDTNNKVTQTNTTGNANYRILFSGSANDDTSTEGARKNTSLKYNPSTTTLTTVNIAATNITASKAQFTNTTADASGTAKNTPALIIGSEAGTHLEFDANEIMAKATDTTTGPLYLNSDGGLVSIGVNLGANAPNVSAADSTTASGSLRTYGGAQFDKSIKIGAWTSTSTAVNAGIRVHDLRSISITDSNKFGNQAANFYFDQVNSKWASILAIKGWTGNSYYSWELAGNADDEKVDRYCVRTLRDAYSVTNQNTGVTTSYEVDNSGWHTLAYLPAFAKKGSTTKPVYVTNTGEIDELTYSLNATINEGQANKMAYYSAAHTVTYAPNYNYEQNQLWIKNTGTLSTDIGYGIESKNHKIEFIVNSGDSARGLWDGDGTHGMNSWAIVWDSSNYCKINPKLGVNGKNSNYVFYSKGKTCIDNGSVSDANQSSQLILTDGENSNDVGLEFWRGSGGSWQIIAHSADLYFKTNYNDKASPKRQDTYAKEALRLQHTSGNAIFGGGIGLTQSTGVGTGISLYNGYSPNATTNFNTYGIAFAKTSAHADAAESSTNANKAIYATHKTFGDVTGTWATYFTADNTADRGWIFGRQSSSAFVPVASIGATGCVTFAGTLTFDNTAQKIQGKDSTSTIYGLIAYNGTNLWVGANESGATHHTGKTYISTGWAGDNPANGAAAKTSTNTTIHISVPKKQISADGKTTTWSHDAYSVLHAGNYTTWTVEKNGTGASGTWGINITGNAATATTAAELANAPTLTKTGTSTIDLTANTTYTLTVGGKNIVFKTPTYTFASGTNSFTVTPSGGSAQTITVTPSIANNITGSGTNGSLAKFNGTNTITNGPALSAAISSQTQSTKFLRADGTWAAPSYTTNTDTKVNVTLGTTTKAYLLGTTTTPTSTATAVTTIADTGVYLDTASGMLNGRLQHTGISKSWYAGRESALIKTTSYTGYNVVWSLKTTNGDWSQGVYTNNKLYWTYITDDTYSSTASPHPNTPTAQISLDTTGNLTANTFTGYLNGRAEYVTVTEVTPPATSTYYLSFTGGKAADTPYSILCANAIKLVNGDLSLANNLVVSGVITQGSDKNIKHDIQKISEKYNKFYDNLQPKQFKYNQDSTNHNRFGFIAQEVEEAYQKAELDYTKDSIIEKHEDNGNGEWNLNMIDIIPLNVQQIQQMKKEIELLKEEIAELRKLVNK